MSLKIGIISLGGKSVIAIAKACKKHLEQVDLLDIKNFEIQVNGCLNILYNGESLPDYDVLYIRGNYKYSLIARSITRALHKKCYMPTNAEAYTIGHDKFFTLL
ncbi:MAG: hypothetical protein PF542_00090 [Nanoarchaeota archaeon]|jgi:hypothetical protein|nr:hypothetical protein [Nanoarchaeota archaeon]